MHGLRAVKPLLNLIFWWTLGVRCCFSILFMPVDLFFDFSIFIVFFLTFRAKIHFKSLVDGVKNCLRFICCCFSRITCWKVDRSIKPSVASRKRPISKSISRTSLQENHKGHSLRCREREKKCSDRCEAASLRAYSA